MICEMYGPERRLYGGSRACCVAPSCISDEQGIIYLGTEWSSNPVVRSDIVVSDFLDSVGGYRHKERRDRLLHILDVDLDWYVYILRLVCSRVFRPAAIPPGNMPNELAVCGL